MKEVKYRQKISKEQKTKLNFYDKKKELQGNNKIIIYDSRWKAVDNLIKCIENKVYT